MSIDFKFNALVLLLNVLVITMLSASNFSPPFWAACAAIASLIAGVAVKVIIDFTQQRFTSTHIYCGLAGTLLLWLPVLLLNIVDLPVVGFAPISVSIATYLGVTLLICWAILPWLRRKMP